MKERRKTERRHVEIDQERLNLVRSEAAEPRKVAKREQKLKAKRFELQQGQPNIDLQKAMSQLVTNMLDVQKRNAFVSLLIGLVKKLEYSEQACYLRLTCSIPASTR